MNYDEIAEAIKNKKRLDAEAGAGGGAGGGGRGQRPRRRARAVRGGVRRGDAADLLVR